MLWHETPTGKAAFFIEPNLGRLSVGTGKGGKITGLKYLDEWGMSLEIDRMICANENLQPGTLDEAASIELAKLHGKIESIALSLSRQETILQLRSPGEKGVSTYFVFNGMIFRSESELTFEKGNPEKVLSNEQTDLISNLFESLISGNSLHELKAFTPELKNTVKNRIPALKDYGELADYSFQTPFEIIRKTANQIRDELIARMESSGIGFSDSPKDRSQLDYRINSLGLDLERGLFFTPWLSTYYKSTHSPLCAINGRFHYFSCISPDPPPPEYDGLKFFR